MNEIFISLQLALAQLSFALKENQEINIQYMGEFPGFSNLPVKFQKTIICESGGRQFDSKGNVLVSNTNDRGIMQINAPIHQKKALKMGYDIDTMEGNLAYGYWLYKQDGLRHWVCAKKLGYI